MITPGTTKNTKGTKKGKCDIEMLLTFFVAFVSFVVLAFNGSPA